MCLISPCSAGTSPEEKSPEQTRAEISFQKGQQYFYQKKFEMAEVMLNRSLNEDPENPSAWSYLGDIYLSRQKYDDALSAYTKAVELKPDSGVNLFRLGQVYFYKKNGEASLDYFNRAFKVDGSLNFSLYHAGLASLLLKRDKDGAADLWEQFLEVSPDDPQRQNVQKAVDILRSPDFKMPAMDSGISVEEALMNAMKKKDASAEDSVRTDRYEGLFENREL